MLVDGSVAPVPGRLYMVAVGKAAVGMARAASDVCGELLAAGVVITKDGHVTGELPEQLNIFEAAHPIPDERGVAATRVALDLLGDVQDGDVVLALISGGGSALLEAPRPPVTLADLAATTDRLLRAGAPIDDLNAVRAPLSLVKGGGLRRAAKHARFVTLLLSDVLGNDPRVIASGPTVRSAFTSASALSVLDRYGLRDRVPASVRTMLAAADDRDEQEGVSFAADVVMVVADNNAAIEAAAAAASGLGLRADIAWRGRQGEASALANAWLDRCQQAPSDIDVVLGGGEATVTVRGGGVGGRNTEFALAAALAMRDRGLADWTVASLATDGQDGPTEVAGAIADALTPSRAAAAGCDPDQALRDNDSLRVFEAAGGLVAPGPTGTNVNDLYFAVRRRD